MGYSGKALKIKDQKPWVLALNNLEAFVEGWAERNYLELNPILDAKKPRF